MQDRLEPYVGASSSSRASSADMDSLQTAAYLDANGTERSIQLGEPAIEDYRTAALQERSTEQTVDIPIGELSQQEDAARQEAATAQAIAADEAAERPITVGTILRDRYVLHRLIGTGGTCRVFLAEDLHRRLSLDASGDLIALKVLRPGLRHTQHSLQRLRREFLQMQQLTHSSITRVFDLDCDGDIWFMTMELVDAHNALNWMGGSYSNSEALRLILSCCEAVAYAHRKGVVHGDLKPGNVLVSGDSSIKLIDFGSVVSAGESEETAAKLEATPQYASPSVLSGNMAEVRDDVFGLGCLAYMILSHGRHPFDRKPSLEASRAQLRPAYIPGIPLRLFEVVVRALAWDPAQRQGTVRELQHALITSELAGGATPEANKQPAPRAPDASATTTAPQEAAPEPAAKPELPEAAPEPASNDKVEHEQGDYSYLSRFRGYVAGPLMDPKMRSVLAEADPPPAPIPPIAATAPSMAPALSVAPPPAVVAHPAAVITPNDFFLPAAPIAERPKGKRAARSAPSQRFAVNAMGMTLVLASAIAAALLSDPSDSERERPLTSGRRVMIPVLTIPTPDIEPVPMPTVLIASNSKAPTKPDRREQPSPNRVAAASVSFESRGIEVSPTQNLVAIPIRRSDSSRGPVRVAWNVEGGRGRELLDSGRAGSRVIQFHQGQSTRTLYVPLSKDARELVADGVRTFQVKLSRVDGGPSPGHMAEVRVTLLAR